MFVLWEKQEIKDILFLVSAPNINAKSLKNWLFANFYKTSDLQILTLVKKKKKDKWQNLSNISVSWTYESNFSIEYITIGCSVFFNSCSLLFLRNPSLNNLYSIRSQDQVIVQTNSFTISVFTLRMIQCLLAILEW